MRSAFCKRLEAGSAQIGLWMGLANAYTAELCAGAGFDWLLIDGEHAPNDLRTILAQLQAVAAYPVQPVVRPVAGEASIIKQLLDIGARNLLVPMVETADQARGIVRAMRYPPEGIRGVGSGLARASEWSRIPNYLDTADAGLCLIVQIETPRAVENCAEIAAVDGVAAVFVGLSDLSSAIGHRGQPGHPNVQATFDQVIHASRAVGKPVGTLAASSPLARRALDAGCQFVAVGTDVGILAQGTRALAAAFGRGQVVSEIRGNERTY